MMKNVYFIFGINPVQYTSYSELPQTNPARQGQRSKMATASLALSSACLILYGIVVCSSTVTISPQARTGASTIPTLSTTSDDLQGYGAFVPTTPSPENVNCYVEVPMVQRAGGQCVRFGRSNMWSCQSGLHVQISQDCERQNRRRERTQARRNRTPRPSV